MTYRRDFLKLVSGLGLVGIASSPATSQSEDDPPPSEPPSITEGGDVDDWYAHRTYDIADDGMATITVELHGSEIPERIILGGEATESESIVSGEEALTLNPGSGVRHYGWDTSISGRIEYEVLLGHTDRERETTNYAGGVTQVFDDAVLTHPVRTLYISRWDGGQNALPKTHRFTMNPLGGWNVAAPGRKVDTNTFDIYPKRWNRGHTRIRESFIVGDFTVDSRDFNGTTYRLATLPTADPPVSNDHLFSFLETVTPLISEYFDFEHEFPNLYFWYPRWLKGGGIGNEHSMGIDDTNELFEVEPARSIFAHEESHLNQRTGDPVYWREGVPQYLETLVLLDEDYITEEEFRHMVQVNATKGGGEVGEPINEPANDWRYKKGSALYAALDMDIRARTDGDEDIGSYTPLVNDKLDHPELKMTRSEEVRALLEVSRVDYREFFARFADGTEYPREVLTDSFSVTDPTTVDFGPALEYGSLDVSTESLPEGESVTITAEVTNVGTEKGTFPVEFSVNGTVETETDVTLESGESTTIEFEREFTSAGTHHLGVTGLAAGTVTVEADEDTPSATSTEVQSPEDTSTDSPIAEGGEATTPGFGVLEGLAGIGAVTYLLNRRLRNEEEG